MVTPLPETVNLSSLAYWLKLVMSYYSRAISTGTSVLNYPG